MTRCSAPLILLTGLFCGDTWLWWQLCCCLLSAPSLNFPSNYRLRLNLSKQLLDLFTTMWVAINVAWQLFLLLSLRMAFSIGLHFFTGFVFLYTLLHRQLLHSSARSKNENWPTFQIPIPIHVAVLEGTRVDLINRTSLPPIKALWRESNDSNCSTHECNGSSNYEPEEDLPGDSVAGLAGELQQDFLWHPSIRLQHCILHSHWLHVNTARFWHFFLATGVRLLVLKSLILNKSIVLHTSLLTQLHR